MSTHPDAAVADRLIRQLILPGGLGSLHPSIGRINLYVMQPDHHHLVAINLGTFTVSYHDAAYWKVPGAFAEIEQFALQSTPEHAIAPAVRHQQPLQQVWLCRAEQGQAEVVFQGAIAGSAEDLINSVKVLLRELPWAQSDASPARTLTSVATPPAPVPFAPPPPPPGITVHRPVVDFTTLATQDPVAEPLAPDDSLMTRLQQLQTQYERDRDAAVMGPEGLCQCYLAAAPSLDEQARRQALLPEQRLIEAEAWVLSGASGWSDYTQRLVARNYETSPQLLKRPQDQLRHWYAADAALHLLEKVLASPIEEHADADVWVN